MYARRMYVPIVLTALTLGLIVTTVIWPGCTIPFLLPLTANAGANATVVIGQSIVLQGSASGGSGQYSYSWSPATGLNSATVAQPTFTPTTIGSRVFTLTATDSAGNTATASVTVTVATNSPVLVADAGPDLAVSVGGSVILQGSAAGGNGQYIYAWSAPAGVTLVGPNTATPVFTPQAAGSFTFTLTVTDTEGATATDTATVSVSSEAGLTSLTWGANVSTGGYQVIAVFSQTLLKSSAETATNYRVTGAGTTPTAATLGSDRLTVTLTFNVALALTSQFDLSVGNGIMDTSGNNVPAISGRTPDRNTSDTTPPSVVSRTWGALIGSGYQVSIVFSEALDRTSAQTASAYRVNGTATTAQSATLGTDGKTVTVVFTGVTLTSSSRIDISVGDVIKDINGNALTVQLNQAVSGTIATATTVSSVTWGSGYTSGGYQILVVFNQAVDATTAQAVANWQISGGTTHPTTATRSSDGKTVTLVFNTALATTDKLDISVDDAIKDANGNAVSEHLNHAITAASGDTTAPTVSSIKWAANYSGGGYQVVVVFNEAMDRATVQATTSWKINSSTTTPSSVALGTDGKTATLLFLAPLAITNTLDVSVGGAILDINAKALAVQTGQAIAAATDVTVPTVASVNWAAHYSGTGYQVFVAFSEALDETSAETLANYRINGTATNPTSATLDANGKTVALVFAGPMLRTDTLDISVGATVKDINGNVAAQLLAQAISANTTDTSGPTITSRVWKTGLATYQATVTFSDAMDPPTAETEANYSMTVNGGAAINPTTATLATDGVTVTLNFGIVGVFKTADVLTVSAAVLNINGRANTSTSAVAMTATAGTRNAAASYEWVAPPLSYGITLTFADVMDKASTTTLTNYTLGASGANPATASLAADGVTLTLTWTTGAFAKTDQLTILSSVHDIAGRSRAESVPISQDADVTQPSITSRLWGSGQTSYRVSVAFSHVMDKASAETTTNYPLGGLTPSSASLGTDGKTVTLTFTSGGLNTTDSLTVLAAVQNVNGRANSSVAAVPMAANPADGDSPTITSRVWGANQTSYKVLVTFSEVLDKAQAETEANYELTENGVDTNNNPATATLGSDGRTVTLTFAAAAGFRSNDSLTVTNSVTDINSKANASTSALTMTANGADNTRPTVAAVPAIGALSLTIVFSEVLDSSGIVAGNFTFAQAAGASTPDPATYTLGADGRTVTITFTAQVPVTGNTLTYNNAGTLKDVNGNQTSQPMYTFP